MEQKQKVWIRGNKTRSKDVIAKLVGLGGIDTGFVMGSCPNCLYFIDEKNRIDSIKDSSRVAKIIMKNYQEIKLDDSPSEDAIQDYSLKVSKDLSTFAKTCINLPEGTSVNISNKDGKFMIIVEPKEVKKEETQFKKGDIVFLNVQGDNKIYQHLIIAKSIDEGNSIYLSVDFCINDNSLYIKDNAWFSKEDIKSIRYATEEEKRTLFLAMLNKGMFWDEKKMKVRTLKDGDVITVNEHFGIIRYSIFKEIKDEKIWSYADLELRSDNLYNEGALCFLKSTLSIRYSTTEERQALFDKIEEQEHKKWNEETKELENIFWRAKKGEKFWVISVYGRVECLTEYNNILSDRLYSFRNYFKTEELAKQASGKIKVLLSKLY